jgi:creatinine amidohydrolase
MLLQLATWQEVDAYLERSRGIIIPVGSTEQHGPLGLIGTDAICPEVIARGVAERIDALVAPTLSLGMAQHHLGFSGTISLRPSTLMAVVRDVVQSLARHGFERCYFLNGHGGNIATLNAAFSEIYADSSFTRDGGNRPGVRCKLSNWYMAPGVKKLSASLFGSSEGSHATPSSHCAHWTDCRRGRLQAALSRRAYRSRFLSRQHRRRREALRGRRGRHCQ